jgi:hypothetical protein
MPETALPGDLAIRHAASPDQDYRAWGWVAGLPVRGAGIGSALHATAGWVDVVLETAGVTTVDRERPARIKLRPEWYANGQRLLAAWPTSMARRTIRDMRADAPVLDLGWRDGPSYVAVRHWRRDQTAE